MSFETIFKWSKLAAVLCVIPLTIFVCLFLNSLRTTTDQLALTAKTLPAQVDDRLEKIQTGVLAKIDTVQDKLNNEITSVATLTDTRISNLTSTSDNRIGKIENDLVDAVNGMGNNFNSQLTTANNSINTLVAAYAPIPAQLGEKYDIQFSSFFDCDKNKLCLQGQASDTMFALHQTSLDTSKTMASIMTTLPHIEDHVLTISNTFATQIPLITANINGITQNINTLTKPKWYDRILGYALNGAVIYRNLNPITSLTVTGAQLLSSQK